MYKKVLALIMSGGILMAVIPSAFADGETPSAPINVTVPAAATTYSSISIIWDKPEDYRQITGYEVYIDGNLAAVTAADETYYTAEDLMPDTEYIFMVKSLIEDNESEESYAVTAKTDMKGTVRNVMEDYNAAGDGVTLDTEAIQTAIDDCEDNDIVLIPEGYTFITGALDLKSNMTLEVNGTLKSSTNTADFEKEIEENESYGGGSATGVIYTEEAPKRLIWSRVEGWEQYCYRSLINIGYLDENTDYSKDENYVCSNVKICGTGTITGDNGISNYAPISGNATALARAEGEAADEFYDIDASETTENNIRSRIRGRLINVSNAQNIYIKGVTVANPTMWTVHMIYSDNVTTNGVTFNTSRCRNGDGWDPDSSTNCTIFNSKFNTGDDCVAIKSGKNPEGNEVARPSENIKIIGCESEGGLGLAVGSEMSGGVSGVYVRDCVLSNTRYGIELKANKVRGGYINEFHVQDSTVDRILIHSVTYNNDGDPADTSPLFSDMSFKNLNVIGYYGYDHTWLNTSIEIEGFNDANGSDDYYVKNVSFEDIVLGTENNVTQNISMKYCRDIAFNNVLQPDGNMPLYATNDTTFTVDGGQLSDIVPSFTEAIEAERMNLDNFISETNSAASGGSLIKINGSAVGTTATAKAVYRGESGIKDICVTYFDENDGVDTYTLYINDVQIDTWDADTDRGSDGADEKTLTNHILKNISIEQGDTVKLVITIKKQYGAGRFDKLEIGEPDSFTEIPAPEIVIPKFTNLIEAEDMELSGYAVESNSVASGGSCISANSSGKGTAKAEFVGENGKYDITVSYFDENDGNASFKLYVNNELVDEWTADQDLGSASADSQTLTSHTINAFLTKGDIITIEGIKGTYDPARVDKLEAEKLEDLIIRTPVLQDDKVKIEITNNTLEKKQLELIVVSYQDERMKNISISEQSEIKEDGSTVLYADAPETQEYKIMLWSSLTAMQPFMQALENLEE